jgi:hypothetical protein
MSLEGGDVLSLRNGLTTLLSPLWEQYTLLDWDLGSLAFTLYDLH